MLTKIESKKNKIIILLSSIITLAMVLITISNFSINYLSLCLLFFSTTFLSYDIIEKDQIIKRLRARLMDKDNEIDSMCDTMKKINNVLEDKGNPEELKSVELKLKGNVLEDDGNSEDIKEVELKLEAAYKEAQEDARMFYENRFDLLELPFLPEDYKFAESILEEKGKRTRIYSAQGFSIVRASDNKWVIATPQKTSCAYLFKTSFEAYHTLSALGFDHSSWEEIVRI